MKINLKVTFKQSEILDIVRAKALERVPNFIGEATVEIEDLSPLKIKVTLEHEDS